MTEEQKRLQQEQNNQIQQNTTPAPAVQQNTAPAVQQPSTPAPAVQQSQPSTQQQAADTVFNQAMGALQAASKPTYNPSYDGQIKDIFNQIMGRESFSYDLSDDALYQMYKQNYADMGKLSMRDSMGQAAALTGGYGSSYGQAVGQQAYDSYLQGLNEMVPELYAQAYGRYQDEGDRLMQQYGLAGDLAADEYAKYQDAYNRYYTEQDYNYARLMNLIAYGYTPTPEEIAAAGMTQQQMDVILNGAGGGGGGGSGRGWNLQANGGLDEEIIKDMQRALGNVTVDGKWGPESSKAAGYLSAGNALNAYLAGELGSGGDGGTGTGNSWVDDYNTLVNDSTVTNREINDWIVQTADRRPADYEKYYIK